MKSIQPICARVQSADSCHCTKTDGWSALCLAVVSAGTLLAQPAYFTRITDGPIATDTERSYGCALVDNDHDGFLDAYVMNGDDNSSIWTANQLFRNNGNDNAWLTVKPIGTVSNRDAAGAKVRVLATYAGRARWQRRDITVGCLSDGNHRYAHFGLGDARLVNRLRIEWPSGAVEEFSDLAPNRYHTIVEPALRAAMKPQGEFELSVWPSTNRTCTLEHSPDLVTWTELTTVTGAGETSVTVADPGAPGQGQRFYRMK
ncbi:MAG: ASPIC/UnbV domain-containing protein [Verrucomicrobiales bacterium]|nr:ASPIC/UnbV domain-containing protein [Verrucomicrobiales bacterium]